MIERKNRWKWRRWFNWWYRSFEIGKMSSKSDREKTDKEYDERDRIDMVYDKKSN